MASRSPDPCAQLEAQIAYFASDDCVRDRALLWRDATPEECWEAMCELCADSEAMLAMLEPAVLERALVRDPLPARVCETLEQLQRHAR